MAIHLLDTDLGSDDGPPTHALVCDREGGRFLLGEFDAALRFVRGQVSDEDRRAAGERYASLFREPATLEEFRGLGMFEFLIRPSESATFETATLLADLDAQITEELIRRYVKMSEGGDLRVFQQLHYISGLIQRVKRQQGAA